MKTEIQSSSRAFSIWTSDEGHVRVSAQFAIIENHPSWPQGANKHLEIFKTPECIYIYIHIYENCENKFFKILF